jgi:anthranilate phosphoribosyltransferase
LRELGICFLFAPKYHPALARVAAIRRALGIRTTFNLVGPMVSPCRAQYRLLGVADQARMADVAGALSHDRRVNARLGAARRRWAGRDHHGRATRECLKCEGCRSTNFTVSPADFGIAQRPPMRRVPTAWKKMQRSCARCSAGERRDVARDLVVLNAAAALHVRTGDGLRECAERAQRSIDEGAALAETKR